MTAEQFAYWLNGFIELAEWKQPTPEQWKSICEYLGTVFVKATPPVNEIPNSLEEAVRRYWDSSKTKPYPNFPVSPYFSTIPPAIC